MMEARVVLLTNNGWEGQALSQRLVDSGLAPMLIVREEPVIDMGYSWPSRFARKLLGDGIVDRLVQGAEVRNTLAWERTRQAEAQAWTEAACRELGVHLEWPENIPCIVTHALNGPDTVEQVRQAEPDVMVVFSTSLLRGPLLALPKHGTLNGHSSLLPHYRGAHSEFWQCHNDDPRYVGITIHLVDPHIDTGPILHQRSTLSTWPSDPFRLRAVNTMTILEHYPHVIKDHLAGRTVPKEQGPSETPLYLKRDVTMELRTAMKRRMAG